MMFLSHRRSGWRRSSLCQHRRTCCIGWDCVPSRNLSKHALLLLIVIQTAVVLDVYWEVSIYMFACFIPNISTLKACRGKNVHDGHDAIHANALRMLVLVKQAKNSLPLPCIIAVHHMLTATVAKERSFHTFSRWRWWRAVRVRM